MKGARLFDSTGAPVTLREMGLAQHNMPGGREYWTPEVVRYTQINRFSTVIRSRLAPQF